MWLFYCALLSVSIGVVHSGLCYDVVFLYNTTQFDPQNKYGIKPKSCNFKNKETCIAFHYVLLIDDKKYDMTFLTCYNTVTETLIYSYDEIRSQRFRLLADVSKRRPMNHKFPECSNAFHAAHEYHDEKETPVIVCSCQEDLCNLKYFDTSIKEKVVFLPEVLDEPTTSSTPSTPPPCPTPPSPPTCPTCLTQPPCPTPPSPPTCPTCLTQPPCPTPPTCPTPPSSPPCPTPPSPPTCPTPPSSPPCPTPPSPPTCPTCLTQPPCPTPTACPTAPPSTRALSSTTITCPTPANVSIFCEHLSCPPCEKYVGALKETKRESM